MQRCQRVPFNAFGEISTQASDPYGDIESSHIFHVLDSILSSG